MVASDARKLSEWNSLSHALRDTIYDGINSGICNTRPIYKQFDVTDKMLYEEIFAKTSVLDNLGYKIVCADGPDVDKMYEYVFIQW